MLILPKSTEIKVMVSKQKIKKMLTQKDSFKTFDNEVSKCFIINEISETTMGIPILLFRIYLLFISVILA